MSTNTKDMKFNVPDKEEMVNMSKDQLEELKKEIRSEYEKKFEELEDRYDKLRLAMERDDALKKVSAKGEFADPKLVIRQDRPLGPIDHQEAAIENSGVRDQLKGKVPRFVSTNPELRSLRSAQGYRTVKDKNGDEVRYMDGVLMAMPAEQYEETIKAPKKARKQLYRDSIRQRFEEKAEQFGVSVEGDGVKIDKGEA